MKGDTYNEKAYILTKIDSSDIPGKVSSKMYSNLFDTSRRMYIYYWDNNKVMFKGFNYGIKKDGKWEYFYMNGRIRLEEIYKEGIKIGNSSFYYENGNLMKIEIYKEGALKRVINYDTSGLLIKN